MIKNSNGTQTANGNTATAKKADTVKVQSAKRKGKPLADTDKKEKKPLKILFAASECRPFIATGGLADVIGSLPEELAKTGADVRVVLPLYLDVSQEFKEQMQFVCSSEIALAWRKQYCGIFSYVKNGVTYYFIDNEYYFKKHGLYGHYDDGERFAFFSKCVLEMLRPLNFIPDVIHCNDWHTALIPVYLKSVYEYDDGLKNIRTVFTIHNIEYQGKFRSDILQDVFGLPERFYSLVEYEKDINFVKGAIQCCDVITTVSPTYAREIMYPYYAHGLHYILKDNEYKMKGILNGIDYSVYNSSTDTSLFKNYNESTLRDKKVNKTELQKLLNLPVDESIPMIAIISRLVSHKGMELVKSKIEDVLKERVQLVVLGKGETYYENLFTDFTKIYSEKMRAIIEYNPDLARKIYAGADILLMPSKSEPCGLAQMIAARYGTVSIIRETGGLADSIRDVGVEGGGNGFTFANFCAEDMYNRIICALNLYQNRSEWSALMKRAIKTDFTWKKSAESYMELYRQLV